MSDTLAAGSLLSMSGEAADRLIQTGSGDAVLLYLSLLRHGSRLAWSRERLVSAMDVLRRSALVPEDMPLPETDPAPPPVTDPRKLFSRLCDDVERLLGRPLSISDVQELGRMRDDVGLPLEVIRILVQWNVLRFRQRYGQGGSPSMSRIRQEAWEWKNQGRVTVEQAREFLRLNVELMDREKDLRRILRLSSSRPLVEKERKYLLSWISMGFDNSAIARACEINRRASGDFSWNYMNAILNRWHRRGLHTDAEVRAAEGNRGIMLQRSEEEILQEEEEREADMENLRRLMERLNGRYDL